MEERDVDEFPTRGDSRDGHSEMSGKQKKLGGNDIEREINRSRRRLSGFWELYVGYLEFQDPKYIAYMEVAIGVVMDLHWAKCKKAGGGLAQFGI